MKRFETQLCTLSFGRRLDASRRLQHLCQLNAAADGLVIDGAALTRAMDGFGASLSHATAPGAAAQAALRSLDGNYPRQADGRYSLDVVVLALKRQGLEVLFHTHTRIRTYVRTHTYIDS